MISSGGAAALQPVTCQVKPKQNQHFREGEASNSGKQIPSLCQQNFKDLPFHQSGVYCYFQEHLKRSLSEEKHQNMSLFSVCVIRSHLVPGSNLLCRKDAIGGLAVNEMEDFREH